MSDRCAILIVDSNEAFSTLLREGLEQNELYRATVVAGGDEALRALAVTRFDLAIVDMGLTDPDGSELARLLRERQGNLRLMVIPLVGEELPRGSVGVDVQGILPKPFFLPELPDRIADALAQTVGGSDSKEEGPQVALDEPKSDGGGAVAIAPDAAETEPPPAEPPATTRAPTPTTAAHRLIRLRRRFAEITRRMAELSQEIDAEAVILTSGGKLISRAGRISAEDASRLAQAIAVVWHASARMARILGREQAPFEHFVAGNAHVLHSLTVSDDIVLSTALLADVPLGMVRHRARLTADDLRAMVEQA